MNVCSRCGTPNQDEHRFCQQCGRRLGGDAVSDPTVHLKGPLADAETSLRHALSLDELFRGKSRVVIGRAGDCDICLNHPTVSRRHAVLERVAGGLRLRDLRSVNGVTVGGQRIKEPVTVEERERIGIGPFLFTLTEGQVHQLDSSRNVRLEALHLEKVVAVGGGQTRKLLEDITLVVEPGEFVSLLGPSGSGKSTLMDCLNGRRRATGGRVLANGEDFYRHFNSFRMSLGYVPQRDIVHTQLTVERALHYTARLRLPPDTGRDELRARVEEVLTQMELQPHRGTLVGHLSGGQIKRVSLGAELLARPCLLYIDEATSGLDAGTESRMMSLFCQLAEEGKSIVCITHNVDNVDRCHLILVLARGKLMYYGPPAEALPYFGVDRLGQIYDRLRDKELDQWQQQFAASSIYQEFVTRRLTAGSAPAVPPKTESLLPRLTGGENPLTASHVAVRSFWHQFGVLTTRYLELTWRDRRSLRLLVLQSPVVAAFLLLGFLNKPYEQQVLAPRGLTELERAALEEVGPRLPPGAASEMLRAILDSGQPVVPDRLLIDPRFTYMLLAVVTLAIMWFGCNNAAKEIVKEEAVYGRERAVNLGILPYLASKFVVLSLMSAVQVLLFMVVLYGTLDLAKWLLGWQAPPALYLLDPLPQYGVLLLLAMTGAALGLLMSACVSSADRANALLPYVLIPQMILGGGLIAIKGEPLTTLATTLSPVYWAYQAVCRGHETFPPESSFYSSEPHSVGLSVLALLIQMAALLALTVWFLRLKDRGRA